MGRGTIHKIFWVVCALCFVTGCFSWAHEVYAPEVYEHEISADAGKIVVVLPTYDAPVRIKVEKYRDFSLTKMYLKNSLPRAVCRYLGNTERKKVLYGWSCGDDAESTVLVIKHSLSSQVFWKPPFVMKKASMIKKLIVVDPGHGGHDTGALSEPYDIIEKNMALVFAKNLKKILEKSGRYEVILTRESDVFVPLRDRIAVPQALQADAFISLHVNASRNPKACGVEVYTQSKEASDQEAQRLSKHENEAVSNLNVVNQPDDVTLSILVDLAQRDMRSDARLLARDFIKGLGFIRKGCRHKIARGNFAVLASINVPALLVEVGYLSNHGDAKLLQDETYQNKITFALLEALDLYFKQKKKLDGRSLPIFPEQDARGDWLQ